MEDLIAIFNAYRVPAQHLVALLLGVAAWRWGGGPERWVTGTFLAIMVVPAYVVREFYPGATLDETLQIRLLIDSVAAVLFTAIALRANRNYPLWIAGFQLVALGAYLVEFVAKGVSPLALIILISGPSYGQLLVILGGYVRHIRRERRYGPYRAWRTAPPVIGGLTV